MQALHESYQQRLEDIKSAIQESEELATFLESEEPEDYAALKEAHESELAELYKEVAELSPLQLEALETAMLDDALEGLFLPRILGYAVLRPRVSERGQYFRPQEHLRDVLLAISRSASFGELERRIGQGVTVGFALSTNVWVTQLIADISNKTIRNFFQAHHDTTLRTPEQRLTVYNRYKRQFRNDNYATAAFPTTKGEVATSFRDLEAFLRYRFGNGLDNTSLIEPIGEMLGNAELAESEEFERFIALVALFVEMPDSQENALRTQIRELSKEDGFADRYFAFLAELHADDEVDVTPEVDRRMALRVGTQGDHLMPQYYALVTKLHDNGIDHLETQDAIRLFTREQEGLSDVNACVRETVLRYFRKLIGNLDVESYTAFFEATKLFAVYIDVFGNESFKQELRTLSVKYVKSLMKRYTDKRGRDYQDIKKFVKTTFEDLGFMTEKEVTNFFKTKRKRTPAAA